MGLSPSPCEHSAYYFESVAENGGAQADVFVTGEFGLESKHSEGRPELTCRTDCQSILGTDEKRDKSARITTVWDELPRAGSLGAGVR